jgi:hypothetical protein
VEVLGKEWSYGYNPDRTGVFSVPPKECKSHIFRESVELGQTSLSEDEINAIIEQMKVDWPGMEYDLLRHNCVLFSDAFAQELGVGPIPSWVTNLAGAGATLMDGFEAGKKTVEPALIIAKAKAGAIDEKYKISSTCKAKARDLLIKAGDFDEQYKVRENAFDLAVKAHWEAKHMALDAKRNAAAMQKEADDDGDGQVSFAEAQDYLKEKAMQAPSRAYEKALSTKRLVKAKYAAHREAADTDGDGKISFGEAKDYAKENAKTCAGDCNSACAIL